MRIKLNTTFLLIFILNSVGFSQWVVCPGSSNISVMGSFPSVSTVDQNVAWVACGVASAPKIYRTTNGGANFLNATGTLTGPEFYAIWAIDANTCLIGDGGSIAGAGGNAKIWRTSDAGITWTIVLTTGGTLGFFNGIAGVNSNRNFAFTQSDAPTGGSMFWAKTTNGGVNWITGSTSVGGTTSGPGSVWCSNTQIFGFGIGGFSRVTYTTNGGTTFIQANPSVAGTFTSGFAASDNGSIMLAATSTSLPNISRSTNGGLNWATINVVGSISGACVIKWVQGRNAAYLSGKVGSDPIRRSTNGGATWTTTSTAGIMGFNDLSFVYDGLDTYGYAVASNSSIIKITEFGPLGINNNSNVPDKFILEQNYPNPFNPSTYINYSIPKHGFVTLKIYNTLGRLVSTLVDEEQSAGNYSVDFDGGELASGIYYYTISSGAFRETKKMILIK